MDKLKERELQRSVFWRDSALRAQPGTQQRPESFYGVDMKLMTAVAVVNTSLVALTVVDRKRAIGPLFQAGVAVVLAAKNGTAELNSFGQNRLDGALLDVL